MLNAGCHRFTANYSSCCAHPFSHSHARRSAASTARRPQCASTNSSALAGRRSIRMRLQAKPSWCGGPLDAASWQHPPIPQCPPQVVHSPYTRCPQGDPRPSATRKARWLCRRPPGRSANIHTSTNADSLNGSNWPVCSIADNTVAVLPNMWQSGHAARWPIRPHIGTALARKYVGLGRDPAALPPGTVSLGLALPLRVERTGPARVERVGPF